MRLVLALATVLAACIGDRDLVPATVDEDPDLPRLYVNDTALHVSEFGAAGDPLVVVVHGGPGGDHRPFLAWQALADDGYHVIMYDQRGAGLSRRHGKDGIGVDLAFGDLQAVIDNYKTADEPVVLFTHSWGSMMGTGFINLDPQQIAGAILTEPGGFNRKEVVEFYTESFDRLNFGEGISDILWSQQFVSPAEHAEWDYMALVAQRDGQTPTGDARDNPAPFWRWGAAASAYLPQSIGEFDWTTRLGEINYPVLWFCGERSTITSEAKQRRLAAYYPDVEFHVVPGAGHDLLYQRQEEIFPIVLDYLDRVTGKVIP